MGGRSGRKILWHANHHRHGRPGGDPEVTADELGFRPGEVELERDGAGVRIEPVSTDSLGEEAGRTVILASRTLVDDELVQTLRDAGQR